jgi:hypothetical protein
MESSCEHGNEPTGSKKMLEISWIAAQLAHSQEGISSMSEWVIYCYILNLWQNTIAHIPMEATLVFARGSNTICNPPQITFAVIQWERCDTLFMWLQYRPELINWTSNLVLHTLFWSPLLSFVLRSRRPRGIIYFKLRKVVEAVKLLTYIFQR